MKVETLRRNLRRKGWRASVDTAAGMMFVEHPKYDQFHPEYRIAVHVYFGPDGTITRAVRDVSTTTDYGPMVDAWCGITWCGIIY